MQKEPDGSFSKRTADDEAERMFWKRFMRTRGPDGKDEYSSKVLKGVKDILGTNHCRSITEIGPGWGNYTFDLAEMCDELVCVDISPDVLNFVKRRAKDGSLNIRTVCSKWEDYPVTQTDAVFGFNCFYRMQNIEDCLRKVDEVGTRMHIIGMTSGPEQPYYIDFEKKLGLQVRYDRLDYILLVNTLYLLGIDCNVRIVPLTNEYVFPTFKELQQSETRRILTEEYDEASVSRILRKYFKREEDGRYHYVHRFNAALIYWRSCSDPRCCPLWDACSVLLITDDIVFMMTGLGPGVKGLCVIVFHGGEMMHLSWILPCDYTAFSAFG